MTNDEIIRLSRGHLAARRTENMVAFARAIIAQARAQWEAELRAAVSDKPMERAVIERFIPSTKEGS